MPIVHAPPSASAVIPFHEDRSSDARARAAAAVDPDADAGAPARAARGGGEIARNHVTAAESSHYVFGNAFEIDGLALGEKPDLLPAPRRPLFGGHCVAEAGGSVCAPKSVMLLLRGVGLAAGVVALVLARPEGLLSPRHVFAVPLFAYLAAVALSAVCSLAYVIARTPDACMPSYIEGAKFTWLSNLTVVLHQFAASAVLFSTTAYWAMLRENAQVRYTEVAVTVLPLIVLAADVVLSARHRYKLFYAVLAVLFPAGFLAAHWAASPFYSRLDPFQTSSSAVAISYGILAGGGVGAALAVYVFSLVLGLARRGDTFRDELRFSRDRRVFDEAGPRKKPAQQRPERPPPEFTITPSQILPRGPKPPRGNGPYVFDGASGAEVAEAPQPAAARGDGPYVYSPPQTASAQQPYGGGPYVYSPPQTDTAQQQPYRGQQDHPYAYAPAAQPAPEEDPYAHQQPQHYESPAVPTPYAPPAAPVGAYAPAHTAHQEQHAPGGYGGNAWQQQAHAYGGNTGESYHAQTQQHSASHSNETYAPQSAPSSHSGGSHPYSAQARVHPGVPAVGEDVESDDDMEDDYEDEVVPYPPGSSAADVSYPGHPDFPSYPDPPRRGAPRQSTVTFGGRHVINDNPLTPIQDPYADDSPRVSEVEKIPKAVGRTPFAMIVAGGGQPAPDSPNFR